MLSVQGSHTTTGFDLFYDSSISKVSAHCNHAASLDIGLTHSLTAVTGIVKHVWLFIGMEKENQPWFNVRERLYRTAVNLSFHRDRWIS